MGDNEEARGGIGNGRRRRKAGAESVMGDNEEGRGGIADGRRRRGRRGRY